MFQISGPAIITSTINITANEWYDIVAERNLKDGSLVVNGGEAVKGKSPGSSQGLNLKLPLFVGGVKDTMDVPEKVGVIKGFIGCVAEVSCRTVWYKPVGIVDE